ncbi:hypothetical protein PHG11b_38 [Flavobacterium phage 11b]|uniref:hypothetical protein n=1 Tax=Flavobacterium phage 11b TaxID=294631 RepID=UPI0000444144|nr:hypothetical protein PHG11b_38 [Flavobacterium phage 11b]CAH56665.1 hypothetical protein PHG11b_38 [Flavobacterium phage 11b]
MIKDKITLLDINFHFGIGFLSCLIEGTGLAVNELGMQDNMVLTPKIMFYARKYACDREEKEINFTIHDIYDLIGDNGGFNGEFCASFTNAFNESMFKNVPVEDKKKVTKAKK